MFCGSHRCQLLIEHVSHTSALSPSNNTGNGLDIGVCTGLTGSLGLAGWATGEWKLGLGTQGCLAHMPSSFPGTYVTRAEATDADDPETDNAALRYSILEQGSPQLFSIDEHTGEIRTVQVGLDREVRPPARCFESWEQGSQCPLQSIFTHLVGAFGCTGQLM